MASCGESLRRDERFAEASALAGPEPDRCGGLNRPGQFYRHPHRVWPSRAHWGRPLNVPVVGVSSLQSLAYGFLQPGRYVCPAINALRGEVFSALYTLDSRGEIKTLWKECRWPLAVWLRKLKAFRKEALWLAGMAWVSTKKS